VSQETSVQDQTYKQVIVMRHDLNMRRGKQIAQGSHASMAFLTSRLKASGVVSMNDFDEAAKVWLSGGFAKICCRVDSEDELLTIRDQASQQGLEVHMITDSGKTEFHGVPMNTCLAIGPDEVSKIDGITGELKLL
jgi:peptidyl-tRNA hydrolase, PTH2 family